MLLLRNYQKTSVLLIQHFVYIVYNLPYLDKMLFLLITLLIRYNTIHVTVYKRKTHVP